MQMALVSGCVLSALLLWPSLGLLPLVCALLGCGLSVMAFTRFVRRKLEGSGVAIATLRGLGYVLRAVDGR